MSRHAQGVLPAGLGPRGPPATGALRPCPGGSPRPVCPPGLLIAGARAEPARARSPRVSAGVAAHTCRSPPRPQVEACPSVSRKSSKVARCLPGDALGGWATSSEAGTDPQRLVRAWQGLGPCGCRTQVPMPSRQPGTERLLAASPRAWAFLRAVHQGLAQVPAAQTVCAAQPSWLLPCYICKSLCHAP